MSPRLLVATTVSLPSADELRFERPRLVVGSRLVGGRFEVKSELGEGGMGVVYEALDAERDEMVALKTLARRDPGDLYWLKAEFRSLSDLVHPNLVRLHELFVDGGRCFFTMELVAGVPFSWYVRPDGELDEPALRSALPQLLSAVAAIHGVGKLHRDLKPSNVLVDPDGRVVVLDFGLVTDPAARPHDDADDEEAAVVGTPGYMAPEQVAREHGTPASDLYSVGVMLFHALTGGLPFQGRSVDVMQAKRRVAAPSALAVAPGAPADLARLSDELLERHPERRPTLEALHERLRLAQPAPPKLGRLQVRSVVAAAPLVGRDDELELLRDAYEVARRGERPVVALVAGESGIGKSALVEGFFAGLPDDAALVLRGRCYEREAVPYKAFDAIVDELSRHLRRPELGGLWSMEPGALAALRRLFPVLGRVRCVADAPAEAIADVRELRHRGFVALGDLLFQLGKTHPLVVFVDDMQWSDDDSTTLLLHLLRRSDAPRMLLIGTHREGEGPRPDALAALYSGLASDPRIDLRPLRLGPLARGAAERLAKRLGTEDGAALARESGGNPFLLAELARAARSSQAQTGGAQGAVSLTGAIQQRLQGLKLVERRLLEVLAVAARPLPLSIAAQAADVEATVHAAMDSLRAECLGHGAGVEGSVECYHDRIREAVVAGLSQADLRSRHLALAAALASQRGADSEHLYTHYEQAGEASLAAEYAREAASRAVRALAFERAISFCDRALALGDFGSEQLLELRRTRAEALAYAGRGPEAADAYLEAAAAAGSPQAVELKRLAAAQLLMSGDVSGGHGLLVDSLASMGIGLPRSRTRCAVSLMWLRARLRLRGLAVRPRASVSERNARKLEALLASGSALSRTDPVAAAEAGARHLLLSLKVGNQTDIARALAWEVLFASMFELPTAHVLDVVSRARSAADAAQDWEAWASLHRHYGYFLRSKHVPEMEASLSELEASLAVHREHPLPTSFYDRPWGEWNRDVVRCFLGGFTDVARELPVHLDDALRRSDMCIYPVWASMVLPRLAVGEADAAEADYDHAKHLWGGRDLTLQNLCMLEGGTLLANFAGRPERMTAALERAFRTVTRSPLYRGASIVGLVAGLHARNAARRAELTGDRSARRELAQTMEKTARWMGRSEVAWADHTDAPVLAAAAYLQGDRETAAAELRRGVERLAAVPLLAHACRRQLGVLLGGDEGRALVDASDAFFQAGGALEPARVVSALNPGFAD